MEGVLDHGSPKKNKKKVTNLNENIAHDFLEYIPSPAVYLQAKE
jgi:hypothetical protein